MHPKARVRLLKDALLIRGGLQKNLQLIVEAVGSITPAANLDTCLMHQYEEQVTSLKRQLSEVSHDILLLDDDDADLTTGNGTE